MAGIWGLLSGLPLRHRGPNTWIIRCCILRHTSRELDWECSSWDSDWFPFWISVPQLAVVFAMTQCCPQRDYLYLIASFKCHSSHSPYFYLFGASPIQSPGWVASDKDRRWLKARGSLERFPWWFSIDANYVVWIGLGYFFTSWPYNHKWVIKSTYFLKQRASQTKEQEIIKVFTHLVWFLKVALLVCVGGLGDKTSHHLIS